MMSRQAECKRIVQIDVAKGIGILLVVIGHNVPENNLLHNIIYTFHMPLFFFLSGLLMGDTVSRGMKSERKLIIKYFSWSGIYLLFDLVVRMQIMNNMTIRQWAWNLYRTISLFGISVLWFLPTIIFSKILTCYIFQKINNKNSKWFFLLAMFLLGAITGAYINNAKIHGIIYYPVTFIVRTMCLSSFVMLGQIIASEVLGYLRQRVSVIDIGVILITSASLIGLSIYTRGTDFRCCVVKNIPVLLIASISGIVGVLTLVKIICQLKIYKLIEFYGKNSLLVMLTHEYFMLGDLIKKCVRIGSMPIGTVEKIFVLMAIETILIYCVDLSKTKIIK